MNANKLHSIFPARERSSVARNMFRSSEVEPQITIVKESIEYMERLFYISTSDRPGQMPSTMCMSMLKVVSVLTLSSPRCFLCIKEFDGLINDEMFIEQWNNHNHNNSSHASMFTHYIFITHARAHACDTRTLFSQISAICWCEQLSWLFSSIIFVAGIPYIPNWIIGYFGGSAMSASLIWLRSKCSTPIQR